MTKKTIPILIFLLLALATNAQITKGNWMVGGNAYFDNSNLKNSKGEEIQSSTQIIVQPNIGYFFYNQFSSGLSTRFGYSKTKGNSFSSTGFGVGPFLRYYFLKTDKRVNLLLEANYFYGKDFNQADFNTSYGFKTGPVIYFNSSVGLEITLDYNSSKLIPNNSPSSSYNNFQIGLGFQIHLEK